MSHTYSYSFWTDFLTGQPIGGVHPRAVLKIYADMASLELVSRLFAETAVQADCITGVVRQASLSIGAECLSLPLIVSEHLPGQLTVSAGIQSLPLGVSEARAGIGGAAHIEPFLVELSSGSSGGLAIKGDSAPYLVPLLPPVSLGLGVSGRMVSELVPLFPPVTLSLGISGKVESVPSPVTSARAGIGVLGAMASGPPPGTDSFVTVAIYGEMQSRLEASFGKSMTVIAAEMLSRSFVSGQSAGVFLIPQSQPYLLPRQDGCGLLGIEPSILPWLLSRQQQDGFLAITPNIHSYLLPIHKAWGQLGIIPTTNPYLLPRHPGEYNLGISGDSESREGSRNQEGQGQVNISATSAMPPQLTMDLNHAYSLGAE